MLHFMNITLSITTNRMSYKNVLQKHIRKWVVLDWFASMVSFAYDK